MKNEILKNPSTMAIKITWGFVAQVVCIALETGIDKTGEPELMKQVRHMGAVADVGAEAIEVLRKARASIDAHGSADPNAVTLIKEMDRVLGLVD